MKMRFPALQKIITYPLYAVASMLVLLAEGIELLVESVVSDKNDD